MQKGRYTTSHLSSFLNNHFPFPIVQSNALVFPPQTSVPSLWVSMWASVFPPITTTWMAEWIIHFHMSGGILLPPSIFSATCAWPSSLFFEQLCILNILQTENVSQKRPWHSGQNQPTFAVLQWRRLHIPSALPPPQLFI